jgi:glycerol kinase
LVQKLVKKLVHKLLSLETKFHQERQTMSQGYVLAIDQGTTGTKVIIFDHEAQIKTRVYSEFTQHYPQPGWVEHDPNEIWQSTVRLVQQALSEAKIEANELKAIGITNQRETVVLWDKRTGEPVCRAIVWQDRRTANVCDRLKAEGLEETFRNKTGLVIDPYFSGTKIKWLLDHTEGLRERALRDEIAFGTIDSWLVWKLTNGAARVTDYSNASRTLCFNINTLAWDEEILEILNLPSEIFPLVQPSSHIYGETNPGIFFGASVPVAGIAGDQQAALFGQACYEAGHAKNTYGTGSFILMNTGPKAVQSKEGLLTTIAWGIDGEIEYALEGSVFITGAAVQWLRDGLGIIEDAKETERLAHSLTSNDGVYFVPALVGLGAPHWDAYARGSIVGITRGTTRAHIARATLESVCYQTRDVFDAIERDSGIKLKDLRVDGGAVGNKFLMQFQSDILGVTVEVPLITETTSLGAAYLAGLAVGYWSSREELNSRWQIAKRYETRISEEERTRLHNRWLRAVEHAKGWARE